MKFALTITDATEAEILSFLSRSSSLDKAMMTTALTVDRATVDHSATTADDDSGPANVNAPAVDSLGMPHDARIHSDNKGLNKDGSWRKRRGVNDVMVAAVETEMKMRALQPQPQFQPPQPYTPPAPQPQFQQPQFQPAPMPHQQPQQYTPPAQPMLQQPAAALDFNGFMQHLSGQMQKRDANGQPLITTDYLASIAQRLTAQFGRQFNSITDISTDPVAINCAVSFIAADGRWN